MYCLFRIEVCRGDLLFKNTGIFWKKYKDFGFPQQSKIYHRKDNLFKIVMIYYLD